jgi:hypothetical protein
MDPTKDTNEHILILSPLTAQPYSLERLRKTFPGSIVKSILVSGTPGLGLVNEWDGVTKGKLVSLHYHDTFRILKRLKVFHD